MQQNKLIQLKNVTLGYTGTAMIENVNFELKAHDYIGIIGPNGAGKSTFLKTILGILQPQSGKVLKKQNLQIGYVPQAMNVDKIFPLSALDIVRSGGIGSNRVGRWKLSSASKKEAIRALEKLGVGKLATAPFRTLSGGQQQRVLIARAQVCKPDVLILDEPTAGMDIISETQLLNYITNLNKKEGLSILLVVHQISLVAQRAYQIAFINKDIPLFVVDQTDKLLSNKNLSLLYRHPMSVLEYPDGYKNITTDSKEVSI